MNLNDPETHRMIAEHLRGVAYLTPGSDLDVDAWHQVVPIVCEAITELDPGHGEPLTVRPRFALIGKTWVNADAVETVMQFADYAEITFSGGRFLEVNALTGTEVVARLTGEAS